MGTRGTECAGGILTAEYDSFVADDGKGVPGAGEGSVADAYVDIVSSSWVGLIWEVRRGLERKRTVTFRELG